jgi:quercetin dioxygenase-like cupin family protein
MSHSMNPMDILHGTRSRSKRGGIMNAGESKSVWQDRPSQEVKMRTGKMRVVAALGLFAMLATSSAAATAWTLKPGGREMSANEGVLLPADHPLGFGATVTPLSLERTTRLDDPTISTFLVDYAPGASAMLHRTPTSGYVLVYVLSGTIRASAWQAGLGTYHTGEIWIEPAFANSIATANASPRESARALVVLVTDEQHPNK